MTLGRVREEKGAYNLETSGGLEAEYVLSNANTSIYIGH